MQRARERLVLEKRHDTRAPLAKLQLTSLEISQAPAQRTRLCQFMVARARPQLDDTVPGAPAECGPPGIAGRADSEGKVEVVVLEHVAGNGTSQSRNDR